jgi:thiol-activated cytolysin
MDTITGSDPLARQALDDYIGSLIYDPRELLAVKEDGATESIKPKSREQSGNSVIITTKKRHSLSKELTEVAILRPTAGVVFPGALVRADRSLMEGQPTPIGLPRAPMTISTELPGLEISKRVVEHPSNSAVQDAINSILEEWNAKAVSQGYINIARSFTQVQSVYSSEQAALDLGFSAKWSSGSASAQLNASTSSEKSTVLAYYKQVFYTITLDTPTRPSEVFGAGVTVDDLRRVISDEHPPAYVRSVDYGRILMIRMETTSRETKVKLEGALRQVTSGGVEVDANLKATYDQIVKNSSFSVVAIGGGAENAARFSGSDQDLQQLKAYIQQDATYRRNNPGAPISYSVAFLKDDTIASMLFTTDYTETESVEHLNGFIKLRHSGAYVARFTVNWLEPDANGTLVPKSWESGQQTAGYTKTLDLPGDAAGVRIVAEAATGLVWSPWGEAMSETIAGPNGKCYRIKGTTLDRSWDNECS